MARAILFFCAVACLIQNISAQTITPASPRFKSATIKACGAGGSTSSSRNLSLYCRSLRDLIELAYIAYKNGRLEVPFLKPEIEGLPDWGESDHFDIDATTDADTTQPVMQGPMLQALLEDRFKLRIHGETRPGPAFALTVLPEGPKLQPAIPGSCPPATCTRRVSIQSKNVLIDNRESTLDGFSGVLSSILMLPVVNRTGIAGIFDFRVEFAPDETTPDLPIRDRPGDASPSIFAALQQLGLVLEPARADYQYLVVDHVERVKLGLSN